MSGSFYFDAAAADRAVQFSSRFLTHQKGELAGKPFQLDPWQADAIVRPLFGSKRPDGTRQYRQAICFLPRKNGKSTLAVLIALYCLFSDNEPGAEVYCAAADREQAAIVFDLAKAMVEASPQLRKRCKVYRRSIVVPSTGSSFKVLSSDASTKHGFNASCIVYDELHAWPNRDLYDVLHTSTGARRQPLEFIISTAGLYEPEHVAWQLYDYAKKVGDGTLEDPSTLPVIYEAPADADYRDPKSWALANPGLDRSVKTEYLAAEAKRAEAEPSYENTFRRLHLGQWTQQQDRWLRLEDWNACELPEFPDMAGRTCVAGLDLSTTTDLSAFVLVFPPRFDGEPHYVIPKFWIPESKVIRHRDRVPYDLWERQGWVTVTPGDVTDYATIRRDINRLAQTYQLQELRFDPWNSSMLAGLLQDEDGLVVTKHGQSMSFMSEPSKKLERLLVGRQLAHNGNPCMGWQIGNATIYTDSNGNIKPDKSRPTNKIDGVVALIMALSVPTATQSVYKERGLIAL